MNQSVEAQASTFRLLNVERSRIMKRGEQIKSATVAFIAVLMGSTLFHEKVALSAGQLRTWSVSRLIEKVREGKLYEVKTP